MYLRGQWRYEIANLSITLTCLNLRYFDVFFFCVLEDMADSIKALWREVDAVCFDVDSTVIREEAIDEVAKFCNKGLEVQQLWDKWHLPVH